MRTTPWPGLRQDTTDLSQDGVTTLHNVQVRIEGELRDRPGLGTRFALQASRLTFLESTGGKHLIAKYTTTLKSIDISTAATTTITTGLNAAVGCFASCLGAVYYANGTDAVQAVYNGALTGQTAGITAPVTAPTVGATAAGSVTAGVHLIRYRYKNNTTGYLSNPSTATEYTAPGAKNAPLTLTASSDAKVDKIVVEMTQAAGSVYYVVATITDGTSYTIDMSDTTLGVQQLSDVYAAPDGFGHDVPPATLTVITEHKNRIFGLAGDYLYWSRPSFPEAFNILDWAKKVFASGGDRPIALGSFFGDLYVFGSQGMARLVYTADPASGMMVQMPTGMGVWSQQTICSAEGAIFGFGRQGAFVIQAIQPEHISQPAQFTLADDVDPLYATTTAHCFFDPGERVVWFMYRAVGDTSVRSAVCYDMQSKRWMTRSFRHTIACSYTAGSSTSDAYAYLADGNGGYTWRLENDVWDCANGLASGVVTSQTGSTSTVINVSQSLPDIVGAILYHPVTGEEKLISANTAGTITVPALTGSVAAGTELYVGSIDQTITSGHVPVHYVNPGRRPSILNVEHLSVTGSTGVTLEIRYFMDYSTTPFAWTGQSDPMLNGMTMYSNYVTQLLDSGRSMVPVPGEWMTTLQWQLKRKKPLGSMRLLDCDFTMKDKKIEDVPH